MQTDQWLNTPEFLAVWKEAFRDAKCAFVDLSENVRVSSKREKTGGLWTQINHPSPGIHLLAIELQLNVSPLSIRLKVWIDQNFPSLYDKLRSAQAPELLGQNTVLSPDQKPRPSWESQLRAAEVSLRGLSYRLPDLSFLSDKTTAGVNLRRMGTEFFVWLVDTIVSTELPSASSETTSEVSPTTATQSRSPFNMPESVEQLEAQLQSAIGASRALSQDARQRRLDSANGEPRQIQVQTSAFLRNADVIVEVLERAKGHCEICREPAPFLRASDGSPYLEVHHILPLARGGLDTVANAQALCPNCHRRLHFGNHHAT